MTVDEIIEKLKTLEKPDSNVDIWMFQHLLGPDRRYWRFLCTNADWPIRGFQYASLTGEIDAARALLGHAMPGFSYRICECSVSDDAWVVPDFNHPKHGAKFQEIFPEECKRDPVEWMGTDVDMRPSGRPAIALCLSIMLAWKKYQEVLSEHAGG